MDGKFFSIYPYDINNNIYTVTHVKYTPFLIDKDINNIYIQINNIDINIINNIKNLIEKDIFDIISNFHDIFEYHDYLTSIKTKLNDQISDNRSLKVIINNNKIMSFIGGKITGIFDINKYLYNFFNIY